MTVPEAAIKAAAQAMTDDWNPDRDPVLTAMFSDYSATALTAATPHLRAGIAEEVRNFRSQFHDDAKTAFGRIGSSTEAYLNALDDVLALLEGCGEHARNP